MSNAHVSIIIPVFNPGVNLKKCLNSVINQTMKNIEIICVDDGSTDDSVELITEYSNKDNRITLLKQKNSGAGIARNKGIDYSTGEYILFLDSDDWIEKDTCEKLYNHAQKLSSDLVIFDVVWHMENNHFIKNTYFKEDHIFNEDFQNFTFNYEYIKPQMMNAGLGVIWCKFYKSSFLKENKITFPPHKIYNDIEFHFKTTMMANRISYFPKIFYHYIKLGQPSLQTSFRGKKDDLLWFDVMMGLKKFLIEFEFIKHLKLEFIEYFLFFSIIKMKSINDELKPLLFEKLKYFFETLNLELSDFKGVNFQYFTFYIHIISSETYEYFKKRQETFNGNVNIELN